MKHADVPNTHSAATSARGFFEEASRAEEWPLKMVAGATEANNKAAPPQGLRCREIIFSRSGNANVFAGLEIAPADGGLCVVADYRNRYCGMQRHAAHVLC